MTTSLRRLVHIGCVSIVALALARPAAAQGGPYVDATTEYSPVTIDTAHSTWRVDRVVAGVQRDRFGVLAAGERQQRGTDVDWDVQSTAFRRINDWTVIGSASATPNPKFLYRYTAEGALARRIVNGLVLQGGYRYFSYPAVQVHVTQPAVFYYFPRAVVEAHGYVVQRTGADRIAATVLGRAEVDVSRRIRVGGGAARGARIFDIAALPEFAPNGWVGYGTAQFRIGSQWSVALSAGKAHEEPSFSQRTFSIGLRRALP